MVIDIDDVLSADDLVGVLTREVRVRLVNISASGCLVESTTRLEPGTAGDLRIRIGGELYADDVRITRVQQMQGAGSTWHVGAEFLWTTQPATRSLRRVVARLRQVLAQQIVDIEFSSRPM
jgi:fatty acid-binding protein DegV